MSVVLLLAATLSHVTVHAVLCCNMDQGWQNSISPTQGAQTVTYCFAGALTSLI